MGQDIEERSSAILRKSREAFIKMVNDLSTSDCSGKQKVLRYMERVLDRRVGAAEAAGKGKGQGKGGEGMEEDL